MKKILALIFLLAVFCSAYVFGQEKFENHESTAFRVKKAETEPGNVSLYTEFLRLNHLLIVWQSPCFPRSPTESDPDEVRNAKKFINLIKKSLSKRGVLGIDRRSNTLVITDERENVKLILDSVKLLDESGFTLEEIVNNPNFEIK